MKDANSALTEGLGLLAISLKLTIRGYTSTTRARVALQFCPHSDCLRAEDSSVRHSCIEKENLGLSAFPPLKRDHEGVPTCKIVFWGPTMAGKTTALTIFKVLKTLEDPDNVFKWLKLEDPTGRTLFFDQGIFGVGRDTSTGLPYLKYHVFTVPGQDRHSAQRKVILQGVHGLVVVIDSEMSRWDENKSSLVEVNELIGDRFSNATLPYQILLNKMDLPKDERISSLEVGKLLVESGANENLRDAAVRIVESSCLSARNDLKELLASKSREDITDENGRLKKNMRPPSVKRVVQPVEALIREILIQIMKQQRFGS